MSAEPHRRSLHRWRQPHNRHPLRAAVAAWRRELGHDRVAVDAGSTEQRALNTLSKSVPVLAVLRPASDRQVQALVRVASHFEIPLYPVSGGRNWGYGCSAPPSTGCAVVDLSEMNRVLDFDPSSGTATLEPGVTQAGLKSFLDAHGGTFLVPVTGAGPRASIVGNALERGFGLTPYADHFGALTSIEAVLADGSLYRSAHAELGGDAVDRSFKWGLGPYLDGLFTQGNFGIVTRATIRLFRRPALIKAFIFSLKCDGDLEAGVHAVQRILRDVPGISGSINLMNHYRLLAMTEPYPWDEIADRGVMDLGAAAGMAKRSAIFPWTGVGCLYGEPALVNAAEAIIRKRLAPVAHGVRFLSAARVRRARAILRRTPFADGSRLWRLLGRLQGAIDNLGGEPNEIALPLAYWKSGRPGTKPPDPTRDGCGLIWYAPLVPMKSDRVRLFVEMVRAICLRHRFEPLLTLTSLSDGLFDCTIPLLFDPRDPEQVARAHACYDALYWIGKRDGFLPYRLSIAAMKEAIDPNAPFWRMGASLKKAVDPKNIIAPGRYIPTDADGTPPAAPASVRPIEIWYGSAKFVSAVVEGKLAEAMARRSASPLHLLTDFIDRRLFRDEPIAIDDTRETPARRRALQKKHFDLNVRAGYMKAVIAELERLAAMWRERGGSGALKILDIRTGDGGSLEALYAWARERGLRVELTGLESSPAIAAAVQKRLDRRGVPATVAASDNYALGRFESGAFDVVIASHLLHLFRPAGYAVAFLLDVFRVSACGWIVADFDRSVLAPALVQCNQLVFGGPGELFRVGRRVARRAYKVEEVRWILGQIRLLRPAFQMDCHAVPIVPYWKITGSKAA